MADKIATDFLTNIKAKSGEAIKWFRDIVMQTRRKVLPAATGRLEFTRERSIELTRTRPTWGKMYLFQYQAKWDEKLPYWDMWPLIFPFKYTKNGFYGINLHYLAPNDRAALMIRLIRSQGKAGNMDENFKLFLSYKILTRFKPAIPFIKRYLYGQVHGRGVFGIGGNDWSYAAALPLQKFQKQSAKYVWSQSALMY